jgi:hypothetical protein
MNRATSSFFGGGPADPPNGQDNPGHDSPADGQRNGRSADEGRTLVVALCMHRCGSSVTTSILHRLGMSLGPFELVGALESNPYGHYEAMPLNELDWRLQDELFGFTRDVPDSPAALAHLLKTRGRWQAGSLPLEGVVERGRRLIAELVASGRVSGFKEPRLPLLWPFWERVLAGFPDLRIVLLTMVRSPHEIAMSIFKRGGGEIPYTTALDVTAVHFERMLEILDQWPGDRALVRFDMRVFAGDLREAARVCGLPWREEVVTEKYDANCKHHEPVVVTHPAQALYDRLSGLESTLCTAENFARLEADAALRESHVRSSFGARVDRYRHEINSRMEEIEMRCEQIRQYHRSLDKMRDELQAARVRIERFESHPMLKTALRLRRTIRSLGGKSPDPQPSLPHPSQHVEAGTSQELQPKRRSA